MPLSVTVCPAGDQIYLMFTGNLDISASIPVCDLCRRISPEVLLCVLDVRKVERVFDSGIALLQMVSERVQRRGGTVVLRGEHPELKRHLAQFSTPAVPH